MVQKLKLIVITVLISVVVLFAADQLLGVLGFPYDIPFRSSHQENITKVRRNIEFEFEFVTNQYGLRYSPIELEKSAGEVRILMLGDSFTEGVGIDANDTFGMNLENHYSGKSGNDVRFINAGLGGQGPLEFWRVFKDVGLKLDPDGLLICIYANDLADTPESLSRADLYRRNRERQGVDRLVHKLLPRIYTIVSEAIRIVDREIRKSRSFVETVKVLADEQGLSEAVVQSWSKTLPRELVEASDNDEFNKSLLSVGLFNPDYWVESLEINTPRAEQKYQAFTTVMNEITAVAREQGMMIGLVYIPSPLQYDLSRHAGWNPWVIGGVRVRKEWVEDDTEIQKRLADWAYIKGIPFLDLTPALREEVRRGRKLNYKLDGHWNAEGHRAAGKAIAEWIDKNAVFTVLPDTDAASREPGSGGQTPAQ
jgi:lysophospholipase L1-like esterase